MPYPQRISRLLFCCLLVIFCAASCMPGDGPLGPGKPAPDFELATLDGAQVSLSDYEGRSVILDFWATWCVPCRAQADILEKVYPEFRKQGVEVLSINMEEDEGTVRRYVEKTPFPYPVLMDPNGTVVADYAIIALPTLVVIDPNGDLRYQKAGITDAPKLRELIASFGSKRS